MIDLHTHTTFSDGELIPAELARRARVLGYQALAITDHVDYTTCQFVLEKLQAGLSVMKNFLGLDVICGVELTHVPPALIADLVQIARTNGAQLVVVHGETIAEPVESGTNLAAIEAGADILAHPGLITEEEVILAAQKGVCLELSTRTGHSLTNGHVVALARTHQAKIVINNDAHAPGDLLCHEQRTRIALGAGLTKEEFFQAEKNSRALVEHILFHRQQI